MLVCNLYSLLLFLHVRDCKCVPKMWKVLILELQKLCKPIASRVVSGIVPPN